MIAPQKSTRLFSRFSMISGVSFWLCVLVLAVSPVLGQQESVVLVHAGQASGYGLAYGSSGNIITALHVVAGQSPITVVWKNQKFPATIEKIYKPADLALLRLQASAPPNIPPLKIYPGDAPMDTPLNFWEAPEKMFRMDKKETKLERAVPLEQLDNRLEKNPAAFANALCSDGQSNYPALKTGVFKFEEKNIRKAHSGSPLTYEGHIVGMVDGGPPINGKGSIWAIPAAGNFAKLLSEGASAARSNPCSSERLYSGLRADNPHLDKKSAELANALAAAKEHPFKFADDSGDQLAFELDYRAPFGDIYETMFEEDQKYIQELLGDEEYFEDGEITLQDLFNQSIDVFQEEETGATIAVPTGSKLSVEQEDGHALVKVSSPRAGTTMIISVQTTNSVEESKAARDWFERYMVRDGRKWIKEEDNEDEIDDWLDDPDEPYYNALKDRVVYGADGESIVAELFATLTIDENDFLGVVIIVNNWEELTRKERIFNYLVETCAILTDFAYY
jgi:hypothetical protein